MTSEEREKKTRIANMLIGTIKDLRTPMLMYQIEKDVAKEALESYIKMLEQQPCEDCISREAVDEYITNLLSGYLYDEERTRLEDLTTYIWELPSVQPTRPTGRWIEKEDYNLDTYYECSECGADYCIEGDILIHKYCPNCGARMTELKEMEVEDDQQGMD